MEKLFIQRWIQSVKLISVIREDGRIRIIFAVKGPFSIHLVDGRTIRLHLKNGDRDNVLTGHIEKLESFRSSPLHVYRFEPEPGTNMGLLIFQDNGTHCNVQKVTVNPEEPDEFSQDCATWSFKASQGF